MMHPVHQQDLSTLSSSPVNSTIKTYCTSHLLPPASSPPIFSSHLDYWNGLPTAHPQSVFHTAIKDIFLTDKSNRFIPLVKTRTLFHHTQNKNSKSLLCLHEILCDEAPAYFFSLTHLLSPSTSFHT